MQWTALCPVADIFSGGVTNFFADPNKVAAAIEDGKVSKFFDWNAPSTRNRRTAVQAEFVRIITQYLGTTVSLHDLRESAWRSCY